MEKLLACLVIFMTACVELDEPHQSGTVRVIENIKEEKIRTKGNLNGYSVSEGEIIEGRTKGANYKRLLISDGGKSMLTKYAYDVDINSNYVNYNNVKYVDNMYIGFGIF